MAVDEEEVTTTHLEMALLPTVTSSKNIWAFVLVVAVQVVPAFIELEDRGDQF